MSGNERRVAEKRFPSTVRKSNITRRRAARSPLDDHSLIPSPLFYPCTPADDRREIIQISISALIVGAFDSIVRLRNFRNRSTISARFNRTGRHVSPIPIVFSTNPSTTTPQSHPASIWLSFRRLRHGSIFSTIELPG